MVTQRTPRTRRELKYLVPAAWVPTIRAQIAPFCEPDPHADPRGSYRVLSLYLDSRHGVFFRMGRSQLGWRRKVRVRTYPSAGRQETWLEVKTRDGDAIAKTRSPAGEDWPRIAERGGAGRRDPASLFWRLYHLRQLQPALLVRYDREAYVQRYDPRVRITIDRHLASQPSRGLALTPDPRRWRRFDDPRVLGGPRRVVLELKVQGPAPAWLARMAERLGLHAGGVSKYVAGRLAWTGARPRRVAVTGRRRR